MFVLQIQQLMRIQNKNDRGTRSKLLQSLEKAASNDNNTAKTGTRVCLVAQTNNVILLYSRLSALSGIIFVKSRNLGSKENRTNRAGN